MKGVSGVLKVFKSVSRVLKGSFMGVTIVFVIIVVIAATRAYGGLVFPCSRAKNPLKKRYNTN